MLNLSRLVGFDTETTGVEVYEDHTRVVQCACVLKEDGEFSAVEWLMDPEIEVPEGAASVHGLTTDYVRANGEKYINAMYQVAWTIMDSINRGIPLIAYNGAFDATLLRVEFDRIGLGIPEEKWNEMILIDPLIMDTELDPYRKGGRKLGTLSKLYGYDLDNAHDASADVYATIHIAEKIVPKFIEHMEKKYDSPIESFQDLMEIQTQLYRDQKTRLQGYFRKSKGPEFTINKSWPFQEQGVD